jgi:putative transposase
VNSLKSAFKSFSISGPECSIPKLLHPYFLEYESYLKNRVSNKKELIAFLSMVRLKERKLKWALKQTGKKNGHLAYLCGIKVRRFQQLKARYRKTGEVPKLNPNRRPRQPLAEKEKALINKALKESRSEGAVTLRLYIKKYYGKNISHNKIHAYLLKTGVSKPDKKKQKQRKYCKYERKHSFSLVHLDWHDSKVINGKHVCSVEDDASRLILAGGEFDHATTENSVELMREAIRHAFEGYSAVILEANTDKGTQFYASTPDKKGSRGRCEFELFLGKNGINHIPSRRNHPQTNGKKERWFRTYEENRGKFKSFNEFIKWYNNRIHLGLSRKTGITPNEAVIHKLRQECLIGLFHRMVK